LLKVALNTISQTKPSIKKLINATFNNISVIFWQSALLVKKTGVPGENHQPVASHWQTLSHNVVSSTPRKEWVQTCNFRGDRHWLYR
jgi:hypothetical protein